jgi:hypothetical protein
MMVKPIPPLPLASGCQVVGLAVAMHVRGYYSICTLDVYF